MDGSSRDRGKGELAPISFLTSHDLLLVSREMETALCLCLQRSWCSRPGFWEWLIRDLAAFVWEAKVDNNDVRMYGLSSLVGLFPHPLFSPVLCDFFSLELPHV